MKEIHFPDDPVRLSSLYGSEEFESAFFYSGRLGAVYTPGATAFRVWAPAAESVLLRLYREGAGGSPAREVALKRSERGVWDLTVPGDLDGVYYT